MTLASTIFKKSTFQKISHLNALGSKFDLDINTADNLSHAKPAVQQRHPGD